MSSVKLVETTELSTDRPVVIMCKSEKKLRLHKFHRLQMDAGCTRLMFKCSHCDEERVYGVEG